MAELEADTDGIRAMDAQIRKSFAQVVVASARGSEGAAIIRTAFVGSSRGSELTNALSAFEECWTTDVVNLNEAARLQLDYVDEWCAAIDYLENGASE